MSTPVIPGRSGPPWDAHHVPLTAAQRLAQDAAMAAELRAYQTDPAVLALRVEHVRTQVEYLMWTGIVLGLCFTMTNVQTFAAAGASTGSLPWCAAWLLDPMVSLVLLAVLRAEQLTTRHHVLTGAWPRIAKWVLLSATYLMNTWASWAAGSPAGIILHSIPPLVVVIAAETVTDLQYALSDCAQHAAHSRTGHHAEQAHHRLVNPTGAQEPARLGAGHEHPTPTHGEHPSPTHGEHAAQDTGEHSPARPDPFRSPPGEPHRPRSGASTHPRKAAPTRASARTGGRKLLADYLAEARAAYKPGVIVTPAWVRSATGCSRGLSPKVASALSSELQGRAA